MADSIRRVSSGEFRKGSCDGAIVVKDFATEVTKAADVEGLGDRVCQFVISTADVDRDGDTIDPNGWDLDSFMKSGVVLWAHDASQPPIAQPLRVWVEDNKLKSQCRFPEKEIYPFADTIYQLILAGVIKCTSVGFKPKEWADAEDGLNFQKQELLEFSVVSVPSNPHALLEAKSLGVDLGPYVSWVEKSYSQLQASGLLVPRDVIEVHTQEDAMHKDADAPEIKAGRVLSAVNEERLQKAMDYFAKGHEHLKAIMDEHCGLDPRDPDGDGDDDTSPAGDSDHDSPSAPKAAADVSSKALLEAIDPKPVDEVPISTIRDVLSELVDGALRRAQGRD